MSESKMSKSRRSQVVLLACLLAVVGLGVVRSLAGSTSGQPESTRAAEQAGCTPGETFKSEGQRHLVGGETFDDYSTSPATSGPHAPQPAAWGSYAGKTVPENTLVHNLEHGGVVIHTKGLNNAQLAQVDRLADSYRDGVVSQQNEQIDAPVVVTAWTRKVECQLFDASVVDSFIRQWCGRGPEKIASCLKR